MDCRNCVKDRSENPFVAGFDTKDCNVAPDPCGHAEKRKESREKKQELKDFKILASCLLLLSSSNY